MMNFFWASVLLVVLFPLMTNTIRCYKCDASDECRTINNGVSSKNYYHASENVEIIDCEYSCWKSVSLGNKDELSQYNYNPFWFILGNVYRGCANKRCAISHTLGTFSSSVCCQTDYCNGSNQILLNSKLFFIMIVMSKIV